MNMKFVVLAALGSLAILNAQETQAADNGFYLGAGLTKTEFDAGDVDEFELDDSSFKLIAGFRPLDWLAFEANYVDLGSDSASVGPVSSELEANALTASALFLWEVGVIDFYAKAGIARWDVKASYDDGFFSDSESEDGFEPMFGVGVGAHFGSIGVRAEYEKFEVSEEDTFGADFDVDTISLSVTYTFL